jgi:hypothetical protein
MKRTNSRGRLEVGAAGSHTRSGDAHDKEGREREGGAFNDQEGARRGVVRLEVASKKTSARSRAQATRVSNTTVDSRDGVGR